MNILKDVASELFSMFVSDARLTAAILAIVLAAAALIDVVGAPRLVGGGVLLAGCVAVLVLSVRREARRRTSEGRARSTLRRP
jgi:Flp pilus assembly protein TadB